MKLRIFTGSIRLRLKQAEVKALAEGREVTESCLTLPVPLTYTLRPDATAAALTAQHDGSRLLLTVPAAWLDGWETDSRVGFESVYDGLQLLIEKDWKCAHPATPADNEDCFDNPVCQ